MPNPTVQSIQKGLTPSEIAGGLKVCIAARRSAMLHGDPGTGKSQIVQQVADELYAEAYGYEYVDGTVRTPKTFAKGKKGEVVENHQIVLGPSDPRPWFKDVRAALLDAVDLRGLPMVEDGKAKWAVPDFLPSDPRGGVLLLDEINRGSEMTMNGLFSICIPPHALGEYRLPTTWVPVAAVNDQDVGARRMPSALMARFEHLDMSNEVNDQWLQDVCRVAVMRDWHPMVIAFLRSFPQLLHKYDAKARVSPNPRGWEFVSGLMHQNPSLNLLKALVAGAIGEAAATEFVAFAALYRNLPNLDNIISNPGSADIPTQPSQLYCVAAALARRVTVKNFAQIMIYLDRIAVEAKRPEFNIACVTDAVRRNKDLQYEPCYTKWAQKYHEVIL